MGKRKNHTWALCRNRTMWRNRAEKAEARVAYLEDNARCEQCEASLLVSKDEAEQSEVDPDTAVAEGAGKAAFCCKCWNVAHGLITSKEA